MSDGARFPAFDARSGTHRTTTGILGEAVRRLGRDLGLVAPFVAAGVVLSVVGRLRRVDAVPTRVSDGLGETTVRVQFSLYPTGSETTGLPLAALVDMKLPYLLWAVGLELLAFLAVGIAGWYTLARAFDAERTTGRLLTYLTFVAAVQATFRLLGAVDGLGLVTLVALVGLFAAFVRLFVAPALVVAGADVRTAVRRSSRLTAGEGVTVFGLVLAVGLSAWIIGSTPVVGTFVSSAVVAPVHAVSIAVFLDSFESVERSPRPR
ncbi:hypothetical protein [Haladaptatus salinisoli]|uniref:hypothetical protein n=1 Tax=Haladaptatus salinisoli TaxID=2884876 RepID=UPI001D0A6546|nr:hypothetical protein [Haladaptatus salinisoli]